MITNTTGVKEHIDLLTLTLIECAVKVANDLDRTYEETLEEVSKLVELITGYSEGDQFSSNQIIEEMSKYTWS